MSGHTCFHCGDVCKHGAVQQTINHQELWFCCQGCAAVAQLISGSDLAVVYQNRTAYQPSLAKTSARSFIWYKEDAAEAQYTSQKQGLNQADLLIEGLSCGACVWLCEQSLSRLNGVNKASIRFEASRLFVEYDPQQTSLAIVCEAIENLGYQLKPFDQQQQESYFKQSQHRLLSRIGVSGMAMMLLGMLALAMHFGEWTSGGGLPLNIGNYMLLVSVAVSGFAMSFCGWPFFSGSIKALKQGGISMDITISLALLLAWGLSVSNIAAATFSDAGLNYAEQTTYFESLIMLLFFILVNRYTELRIRHQNLADLTALQSVHALMVEQKQGERFEIIKASDLVVGDVIRIKAGQTIAADGIVVSGAASVDESIINGEFTAVAKTAGDTVLAGSVLIDQVLELKVTALGGETHISAIEHIVQQASHKKANVVALADRYANVFLSFVLFIAVAAGVYWAVAAPERVFDVVLAVLIAACPCALSIATPSAIAKTSLALRQNGVLLRDIETLFRLEKIKHWVFDKTGSLTAVKPEVDRVDLLDSHYSEQQVLEIAAALESNSSHVLSAAFTTPTQLLARNFQHDQASGVEATIGNERYRLGKAEYIQAWHAGFTLNTQSQNIQLILANESVVVAVFTLSEQLRTGAQELLATLSQSNLSASLLSGDKQSRVNAIADVLPSNIEALGEQTTENKLAFLQQKESLAIPCAMVGDGVNDAAAMAAAEVSIAVASASDLATAKADVALLSDDLKGINLLLDLSKRCRVVVKQGFYWSLAYNAIALVFAAMGYLTPFWAVVGMVASSFIVLFNSRRIAVTKKPSAALHQRAPRLNVGVAV